MYCIMKLNSHSMHCVSMRVEDNLMKNTPGVKKGRPRTKQALLKKM